MKYIKHYSLIEEYEADKGNLGVPHIVFIDEGSTFVRNGVPEIAKAVRENKVANAIADEILGLN